MLMPGGLVAVRCADVMSIQLHRALRRRVEAKQEIDESRFARAIVADQEDELAGVQREVGRC